MKTPIFKKFKIKDFDFLLFFLVIILAFIGYKAVGSARASVQYTQFTGLILGIIAMIVISFINYDFILKFYWPMYILCIVLLLLVAYSPWKDDGGGAVRWLEIPHLPRFQPSELAKILLILFFAKFIMKYREKLNTVLILCIALVLYLIPLYLIYKQPDLSTTIVIMVTLAVVIFLGGLNKKIVFTILAIAIPIAILLFVLILQPDQKILDYDYQQGRILAWLYPDEYEDTTALQQRNSIMAIGSGQLSGKGLNNDQVNSMKNGNFIPEPHTDFIFAVIGEEMGFIGTASVVGLIFLIVLCCFRIGYKSKDLAGTLIACGVGVLIGIQSTINLCVTTGLLPNTGMTLPFVSYGRTSLISMFAAIGIVINVGLQPIQKYNE